jgi:tetratricopeptide (TPR) repeat protein
VIHEALVAALGADPQLANSASNLAAIAHDAADAGDREVFLNAAAAAEKAMKHSPLEVWRQGPRLARGYLSVARDRDAAMRLFQAAEAAVPKLPDARDRHEVLMDLAATDALLGEHDRATRRLGTVPRDAMRFSETFWWIPRTYAATGDFDRAIAITERYLAGKDRDLIYEYILKDAARAGRFALAVDIAGRISWEHKRIQMWALVAHRQAAHRPTAELAAWIDRLPTPRARAVANLAVAQQLLGVRLTTSLKADD